MSLILISSILMSCVAGFVIISYSSFASQKGWPTGKMFRNNAFVFILGGLSIIGTVIFTIFNASFLWGIGVFALGWLLAFILTFLLKSNVQFVALFLLVFSWILQFFV